MNAAQIHLALNHLPIVGVLIGLFTLVGGFFFKKNSSVQRTGLAILIFAAVTAVPAFLSGEPAEELIEHRAGVSESRIHDHEEAAELSLILASATGLLAAAALLMAKREKRGAEAKLTTAAALTALVTLAIIARVAHLGGLIRHEELQSAGIQSTENKDSDSNSDS